MDEQQMTQPTSEYLAEADGLAYTDTGSDIPESEPITVENFTDDAPIDEPITSGDGNVTLTPEGDVEFNEDFFSDMGNEDNTPEQLKPYTREELQSIPFEHWDENRIEGNVQDYIPIVRDQMMRRQMEQQIAMRANTPPVANAPQQYTPSELAEDAKKLACERLGIDDPDDFDEYEGEHQAALNIAMQELSQRRTAEVAQYQRVTRDYQDLQRFNAELVRRPDYAEFDRWFSGKLQEAGVTAAQVDAGLQTYALKSGGDFGSLRNIIAGWYQEFQQEKTAGRGTPMRRMSRPNRPPVLESPRGTSYEGRRSVDMRKFGSLDQEAQARALMRMGYC